MFLDRATEAMWSQIWKRVVSLLKVGFLAMISFVTFVLFCFVSFISSIQAWGSLLPILVAKSIDHGDLKTHV